MLTESEEMRKNLRRKMKRVLKFFDGKSQGKSLARERGEMKLGRVGEDLRERRESSNDQSFLG